MLPSTGYFKGNNCPFYDSGLCERPYCHFRHVKKDNQNTPNEEFESGAILQKLVSAAVQKVLQQKDATGAGITTNIGAAGSVADINNVHSAPKAIYNPTPISELNKINNTDAENNEEANEQKKRHIPVPYTPRKPASLPISRPFETNGASKPFVYIPPPAKYTPGCADTAKPDPYLPKGCVESNNKYLPGTETELQEYTPKESPSQISSSYKANYVPSDKSNNKKKILEYKPIKVSTKAEVPSVSYQPTPRSLVPFFSSDEDEPELKKRKLSSDLNGLDELGPEFDILDQILDEEKSIQDTKSKIRKADLDKALDSKDCKGNSNNGIGDKTKKEKSSSDKNESKRANEKTKDDEKEKSKSYHKERKDNKSKSSDRKPTHKSSSKDRTKEIKDKESTKEKPRSKEGRESSKSKDCSSSKRSSHSSKPSENSSKSSDKNLKHANSSNKDRTNKNKTEHHKLHKRAKQSKEKHESKKREKCSSKDVPDSDNNSDNNISGQNDEDVCVLSESDEADEDTIALECKRIFEEYVPEEKSKIEPENCHKIEDTPDDEYIPLKKRISRTNDRNIIITPKPPPKPNYKVRAAQLVAERLAKVREFHTARNLINPEFTSNKIEFTKNIFNAHSNGNSKIRIAHVPYASTLLNAKKTIPSNQNKPSTSTTIAQTTRKGEQRVAHMPNDKFIDRPGVLEPLASKIPANIRSTYLNMMIEECLKIYALPVDAYARAQHEELTTSKKCSTVQIYKNSAVLTVSRLRKELQECNGIKKSATDCSALQKLPLAQTGKPTDSGSWSIENKSRKLSDNLQEFSGAKLYNNIKKWVLTEQELHDNGFPMTHPSEEKGRAIIHVQRKQIPPKGFIRTCCRCKKEYTVDKKGFPSSNEECIYHPNNKYRVRGEARYQCCSQDGTSDGCCIAPTHVYEYVDYENLRGYIRTLPPDTEKDDYGVYSLDCEMCYTTHGLDLTRITVINSACKVVYETLIKPLHPIVDYNTRYSGITEEQMVKVKTTLIEVQATLLAMFNNRTILIGHSLESDFKALKLIHDTVIDTSVLFPHKMGPPYKRALRNLSSEYLKKIIQNSVDGHDSAEDATVCMELIHFKLKEDLKTR